MVKVVDSGGKACSDGDVGEGCGGGGGGEGFGGCGACVCGGGYRCATSDGWGSRSRC